MLFISKQFPMFKVRLNMLLLTRQINMNMIIMNINMIVLVLDLN